MTRHCTLLISAANDHTVSEQKTDQMVRFCYYHILSFVLKYWRTKTFCIYIAKMLSAHVVFVCREGGILTCVKELLWMTVKYAEA